MKTQHRRVSLAAAALAATLAATLAGCSAIHGSAPVKLHAYDGPLATTSPDLVIDAVSTGDANDGTFSYALPDGATCRGTWMRTTNVVKPEAFLPDGGMIAKHGGIRALSEGNTISNKARNAEILGAGNCSNGATFMFASVANGYQGRGALKDSNGNIFKIVLR